MIAFWRGLVLRAGANDEVRERARLNALHEAIELGEEGPVDLVDRRAWVKLVPDLPEVPLEHGHGVERIFRDDGRAQLRALQGPTVLALREPERERAPEDELAFTVVERDEEHAGAGRGSCFWDWGWCCSWRWYVGHGGFHSGPVAG